MGVGGGREGGRGRERKRERGSDGEAHQERSVWFLTNHRYYNYTGLTNKYNRNRVRRH